MEVADPEQTKLPAIETTIFIAVPVERVYKCLTTAEGWNSWFTDECAIDLRIGGHINLVWRDWSVEHIDVEDGGPIVNLVNNELFAFKWHRNSTPSTVTFLLQEHAGGTILKLTDSGYVYEELSKFAGFLDCAIGWGQAVTLLKFFLEHGVRYAKVPR